MKLENFLGLGGGVVVALFLLCVANTVLHLIHKNEISRCEIEALKEKAKMYQMGYEYYLNLLNVNKKE